MTIQHPDVHRPWAAWSEAQTLHVASPYSNPFRWRTRRDLLNDFRRHMACSPNVVLHVGELAYGNRPFEVTGADPNDVQMRTAYELFHKENIINLTVEKFPPDWQYGAYIDGDFTFTRNDWALEAIHQLQHYDFVQLFSSYADLSAETYGTGNRPTRVNSGFAFNYVQSGFRLPPGYTPGGWKTTGEVAYYDAPASAPGGLVQAPVGATGGAWAFRRSAFDAVGGMLDTCILGHGDWFMAFGLVGSGAPDVGLSSYTDGYRHSINGWQLHAARLKANIGYVDNYAVHHFHGSKTKRAYTSRFKVLVDNKFDPVTDLTRDWQGVWQLAENKPRLRDEIRAYFISRAEDNPNLLAGEKALI